MAYRFASLALFALACASRVDSMDSTATESESTATEFSSGADHSSTTPGTSDGGEPQNDAPFAPSELVECGAGWETTVGGGALSDLGFPRACNPRAEQGVSADGYRCCSTDPATADGGLPAYTGKNITGSTPIYADAANDAGRWGMCMRTDDIPSGSGLLDPAAENCPIPCDPTWVDGDVATVCGSGRVCCQTTEIGDADCVREDGVWRPVTGADIGEVAVVPSTVWNNVAHETHQDPNGTVCSTVSGGYGTAAFNECIRHLGVANRRGFCMALGPGQACPGDPSLGYIDACAAMNG